MSSLAHTLLLQGPWGPSPHLPITQGHGAGLLWPLEAAARRRFRHRASASCPAGRGRARGALFLCNKVPDASLPLMTPGSEKGKLFAFCFCFTLNPFPEPRGCQDLEWEHVLPIPQHPPAVLFSWM